jgi:hypothetical protein
VGGRGLQLPRSSARPLRPLAFLQRLQAFAVCLAGCRVRCTLCMCEHLRVSHLHVRCGATC